MRWTVEQYNEYQARRAAAGTKLPPAEPKQKPSRPLVETEGGKAENPARIGLRIITYRCFILDSDNAYGGTKQLIDCLCSIGLLPGDSPAEIYLQVEQVKVPHLIEQRTVVEITYPNEKPR